MSGSEFDSHRRLPEKPPSHDEEAEAAADPDPDTYSDDGYTPRDEPRSAKTKHGAQKGQRSPAAYCLLFTAGLLVFSLLAPRGFYTRGLRVPWRATTTTTHGSPTAPLNVFQVYPPVRVGAEYLPAPHERAGDECSVVLMQHEFAWSYGRPFVGSYAPPGCRWTHVLFNLTMTSRGRQFDRLGMLFLGDVEVFRTSTAEPTQAGIVFSYVKDMTAYTALLSEPQKLIFDLGNLVDSTYTGVFAATLTATFYTPPPLPGPSPFTYRLAPATAPVPAQHILPISVLASAANTPSHFVLPGDNATTTHTLPRNTIHALVSLSASGNADEEFWYTNVPTAYTHTFPGAPPLPGASPFREIQLLVNGHLAGVAWPFPQIYTGGVNPALWRPIVGIAAYDVPEYTIDITPLLPALLGRPTTFEIRVVARDPTEQLPSNWIVSGRVFVWTDRDAAWTTTGTLHAAHLPHPAFTTTTRLGAGNTTLYHRLTAQRALSRTATINTSAGPRPAAWTQGLAYESVNVLSGAGGSTQQLTQQTRGSSASAGEAGAATFSWPLALNTTFAVDDAGFTIWASVDRGVSSQGPGAAFPRGGAMHTRLNGSAVFVSGGRPGTWGATGQTMRWVGAPAHGQGVGGYGRVVAAEGGRVREDWEWVNGVGVPGVVRVPEEEEEVVVGGAFAEGWGVRRLLGRGPA